VTQAADTSRWVGVVRLELYKSSETFIASQAEALSRYRPVYIGRRRFGPGPAEARDVVPRGRWAALRLWLLADVGPWLSALEGVRPAVIHAHFGVDAVYALPLARRLGAPLVVTLHGFDVTRSRLSMVVSLRPALVRAVLGWPGMVAGSDRLVAVSQTIADAAAARGAPPTKLVRLPTGVDLNRLRPAGEGEPDLVVFVGRLVEKKGCDVLLQALRDVPDARLMIVGAGPLRRRLVALVRRLGLMHRVTFLGALAHVDALSWMARARVVVVPSRVARNGDAEGLPTVVLEAAALARAIVASRAGGVDEAMQDGESALLTPPGEAAALARALTRLLGDPRLAARLGEGARRAVETGYDLRRQTRVLEDVYDEVLASKTDHAA
jgi:colanic acid/amylovoran biosynthesis glycosyltransferase